MDDIESFCGASEIWDETLLSNNTFPEFTDCFQNTILVWIPCGFLWITAPCYLYALLSYKGSPRQHSFLNIAKTFISGILFILTIVDIFKAISDHRANPTPIAVYLAAAIKLLSYFLTICEIQLERIRGFVTSGILFIFWFTSLIASVIPFYTLIIKEVYSDDILRFSLFFLYFILLLSQFILHCIAEEVSESSSGKYNIGIKPCLEVQASFLSRITYWWMNGLIITGYKKDLEETDIADLHPRDKSDQVVPNFEKVWKKELKKHAVRDIRPTTSTPVPSASTSVKQRKMQRQDKIQEETPFLGNENEADVTIKEGAKPEKPQNKASLTKTLFKVYGVDLFKSWGCKLVYDFLQFTSPLLLNALIGYTNKRNAGHPVSEWQGYILAAGFFVVAIFQSTFFHQNFHISMTTGMRARSALIAAVFKKSLTMNNEARKSSTVGEIVNLMSVDCQRFQDVAGQLWMIWSAPLQIILATVLLWQQLGPSVLAGVGVMLLLIPINIVISTKQRKLQADLMRYKDNRIKMMNEILSGMKVLKLYAWESSFQDKVTAIRKKEVDVLRQYAYLNAFSSFSFTCAPFLVTLATFATYIMSSTENYLDAQKAFVSLSLFNILRFPINLLPMMISFMIQTNVSIKRLSAFLKSGDLNLDNVQHEQISGKVIKVENGTFTWDSEAPPALKNIDLEVAEGELIAVVGTVGSGKSSLISAFLGEMDKLQGKVNVKGKIAYVPQQAWIQNATVKDNILFGREMNLSKYDQVIESCSLKRDFEILTGGDMTEIGEKGINLSAGQKQRISLARAVYNNADIYLLDDPLSAVDSHVGKHMFKNVFGKKGLLKNKTRILVTHGIQWLPMVDRVIVLVDGQISEMGTYEELLSHEGAFAQFLNAYFTEVKEEDEEVDLDNDPEVIEEKCRILERFQSVTHEKCWFDKGKQTERRADKLQKKAKLIRTISMIDQSALPSTENKVKQPEKKVDKLIEKEKEGQGKIEWKVFMSYFRAVGIPAMVIIFLLFSVYQGTSIFANIWLSWWSDDDLLANRTLSNTTLYSDRNTMYLGVYGGLGVVQAVLILIYSLLGTLSYLKAAAKLHHNMLVGIMRAPMSFFDTTPSGRIVNRFSGDVQTIDVTLPMTFRMWIMIAFQTLSTVIVISISTPIFLSVIVPLGIFYYFIQRFYIPSSRQLQRLESTSKSPIFNHFSETLSGATSLRAYKAQDRFIQESLYRVDKNISYYFTKIASQRWLGWRLELIGNLIVFAAALFAVLTPNVEGGVVGLSISYALQITGALNMFVRTSSDLESNVVSVERTKEYAEVEREAEWINPNKRPPSDWPVSGECKFENYQTRYRAGLDLVIRGITCNIAGGQKVGIVGRTGAGKSSLAMALFRLIESAEGKIIIDGECIAEMGLHDLRQKLTILPQDPVLFSGSLRMNLDPIEEYSDEQLWKSLEHAHLKNYVEGLADKLDYECGEGGQNLSVGQRQLVCLGRSLLHKTKILILDEATAAVDMETDELIQKTIRSEFKDCTILTIAHRLNTILDYDKVMVLDQGKIAEFDGPNELLEDKNSIFHGMAKAANIVS
ncbi:multidrug resistance-associated protein 1-like [Mytilus trossulus]|uniref:multidrug resistance-associated protein 1-like n=1 Tax=Mytilus trossulus TaxID=6551 RepID=UPI003007E70F